MFDLSGKVALVTGAGRGIGAGIAHALARQGAAVGVNDLSPEGAAACVEAIREAGGEAAARIFDVRSFEACEEGIGQLSAVLGEIDILVNNAGGSPGGRWPSPFLETPREVWHEYMALNLDGVFHCTRVVAEGMAARGWGRVVSISSDAGRIGSPGSSIYGAAKAGAEGFMRTLSMELGRKGVTANSIALGLIDTVPPEFLESVRSQAQKLYSNGRIGTAEDVAAGVVYLVSDEAGHVNGHTLVINGGAKAG